MPKPLIRCAIYTRKSTEDGLEQEFNALDAQREACLAYIASQRAEGWRAVPGRYGDGGLSGGTLERPALNALLTEVSEGRVDRIVVYKIDRLTRSLRDFAKIVDVLDKAGASFVSVTQSFNTATSMGRLTLNMLLSFAQFEREVTAERIRDKVAASKRKGLWMGGAVPYGYVVRDKALYADPETAEHVQSFYRLYLELGSLSAVAGHQDVSQLRTRILHRRDGTQTGVKPFSTAHIHRLLSNPIYTGHIPHKGEVFEGQHDGIIDQEIWDHVQAKLASSASRPKGSKNRRSKALLAGKLIGPDGVSLTPTHTIKNGRTYRYFVSRHPVALDPQDNLIPVRLPEHQVATTLKAILSRHFRKEQLASSLTDKPTALELQQFAASLERLAKLCDESSDADDWAHLIKTARFDLEAVSATLDRVVLATSLRIAPDRLREQSLLVGEASILKRRGHELRILTGLKHTNPDPTLVDNLLKAQSWYQSIREGKQVAEIARDEGVGASRIRYLMPLAFLSPRNVKKAVAGEHPVWFTTQYVKKNGLPADWRKQDALLKASFRLD
ncbi:MAG: recombinase family protein [Dinoroseobacter sp.]|nr:recombinase family protein [Dinoroseobacter sp.]